jgi:hypothetical protein
MAARLGAGGTTRVGVMQGYSVADAVPHGLAVQCPQMGDFTDDYQRQEVLGQIIPIQGTLGGFIDGVVNIHDDSLCMV